jgi:hypothetical protein
MLTLTRDLDQARSTYQVVLLAREYLAALSANDVARVPEQCRPPRILDEADLVRYSRRLTDEYWELRGTAADVGVLQELWSFFLRATIQITRLQEQGAARG